MKCIDNVYSGMTEFENLYEAYRNARRNKRFRGEIMRFTMELEKNLIELQNELLYETYRVSKYRKKFVRFPKLRLVMALQFRDRVVQWAIYSVLNPYYDKRFIEDSFACRVGKGQYKALDRVQYWLRLMKHKGGTWYVLKMDIKKFYYRVVHEILLDILQRNIKDARLMRLIDIFVNSEDEKFGLPQGYAANTCPADMWLSERGIPTGNLTSQLFGNIYLNELDQYVKHVMRVHYYIRYADDILLFDTDKSHLADHRDSIEIFLDEKLGLQLNEKTTISPVKCGVNFIGYKVEANRRRMRRSTARHIIRGVKHQCAQVETGELSHVKFMRTASSYRGLLDRSNTNGLRRALNKIYTDSKQKTKEAECYGAQS